MHKCIHIHLDQSRYEGGIFSAVLNFPADFPNNPPEMKLGDRGK